jgi:integrase
MAIHKLKPAFVETVTRHGVYSDGGGLYLRVQGTSKSWIFRFARSRFGGSGETEMGLGAVHTINVHDARELARQCRAQLLQGVNPLQARKSDQLERQLAAARDMTFGFCAADYFAHMGKTKWEPTTHALAKRRFEKYVLPKLQNIPISAIDHLQIEEVLRPIWESIPTQASIIRQHIEAVFDRATAKCYRVGDNPASLKGPLGVLMPSISEIHTVEHLPSLPYQKIGAFMAQLRSYKGIKTAATMAAVQLEFIILTAVRGGETHEMQWSEIDWENRLWTCPAQRTKLKKEHHIVPLSEPALAILEKMRTLQKEAGVEFSEFVFVRALPLGEIYHDKKRQHRQRELACVSLPDGSASRLLYRSLGRTDITLHGFRTTFSSWANDHGYEREAIEMALGHKVGNKVERIYSRDATRLQQRRILMEDWGKHCGRIEPAPGEIIPFRQAK